MVCFLIICQIYDIPYTQYIVNQNLVVANKISVILNQKLVKTVMQIQNQLAQRAMMCDDKINSLTAKDLCIYDYFA